MSVITNEFVMIYSNSIEEIRPALVYFSAIENIEWID